MAQLIHVKNATLRRRGAALPMPADANAMAALERCQACAHTGLCPNTHYVEWLREARLKF